MTVSYACDMNMYMCVNFEEEIMLRGKECRTRVNLNFSKNGEKRKLSMQYRVHT